MGHGKETPRQKMIGMMYLVLTAMLALNVSKDILDAFVIVNESITKTNKNVIKKNERLYFEIDKANMLNPVKAGSTKKKADQIKKMADELYNLIQDYKIKIIRKADGEESPAVVGREIYTEKISAKDNKEASPQVMMGEGSNTEAIKLRKKIEEFRKVCLTMINLKKDTVLKRAVEKNLDTEPPKVKEGQVISWEAEHFEHWPMVGAVTIMSGMQGNIRNAETDLINYLLNQITANDLKFNKIEATVIPSSNYVIKGTEYQVRIFLAAMDSTQDPEIYIGDYQPIKKADGSIEYKMVGNPVKVKTESGIGIYKVGAGSVGNKKIKGLIQIKDPEGNVISRPFEQEYIVAEAGVVISPTKMNVFYLGLDNPVDISVPGFAKEKLTINVTNATYSKDRATGEYLIKPLRVGANVDMTVFAEIEKGKKKNMGTKAFRVKGVPNPVAKIAGITGGDIQSSVLRAQRVIIAELPDFLFDLKFEIVSFNMYTTVKGFVREASSKNNMITADQKSILESLSTGSRLVIESIKVKKPGGVIEELGAISLKVK